jgi:fatty-acyl-CoA synthase
VAPQARTIVESLEQRSTSREIGFTHMAMDGSTRFESFHDLYSRAQRVGLALQRRGFVKGDRLGLVLSDSQQFIDSLFGAFLIGAVPVPLSPPSARFGQPDVYLRHIAPAVTKARPRLVLVDGELQALISSHAASFGVGDTLGFDALLGSVAEDGRCEPVAVLPDDPALLQFTSGSTSQPKGVRLNHSNLIANVRAMADPQAFACTPDDSCVTWLPLHHDMGLIAQVLMPVDVGMRGVLFMPPGLFLADPVSWLRQISQTRATFAFAPNFAFSLCTLRANARNMEGIDLSCVRVTACAAEPIRQEVLQGFARKFEPHGLAARTLMPCYGLSEHTLGASITPAGTGMAADRLDAAALTQGSAVLADASASAVTTIVNCGRFLPGHEGKVVDAEGNTLPDGQVGELLLRGPSVLQDYFEDEAASATSLRDGWLHTGDLAYLRGDNLYVCGRSKDVLILYGRKFHPQDLEWEAEQVQGIRPGCVAALGVQDATLDRDRVVIVAESKLPADQHPGLQDMIRARIQQGLAIMVDEVVVVPAQTLPKTSSGKLQRLRTRAMLQAGALAQPG